MHLVIDNSVIHSHAEVVLGCQGFYPGEENPGKWEQNGNLKLERKVPSVKCLHGGLFPLQLKSRGEQTLRLSL